MECLIAFAPHRNGVFHAKILVLEPVLMVLWYVTEEEIAVLELTEMESALAALTLEETIAQKVAQLMWSTDKIFPAAVTDFVTLMLFVFAMTTELVTSATFVSRDSTDPNADLLALEDLIILAMEMEPVMQPESAIASMDSSVKPAIFL